MPIKFLLLGGGFWDFFRRGGWKCQFYFYGRGDFSDRRERCHRRCLECDWKAETRPFAEYDPLCVHPSARGGAARSKWTTGCSGHHMSLKDQHPSPDVKNPLPLRADILARNDHITGCLF